MRFGSFRNILKGTSADSPELKMNIHPVTLAFDKNLESLFLKDYFLSSINLFRIAFSAGFLYFGAFVFLDLMVLPDHVYILSLLRFLIVCPVILLVLILSFTNGFEKYWQFAATGTAIVSGIGIIIMTIVVPEIGRNDYYVGIIQVLIYCYLLIRLRFIWATLAGWIVVALYILSHLVFPGVDKGIATTNIFFLTSANIIGMIGGYALEYFSRREFFYRYHLQLEHLKVEEANALLEEKVREKTSELQKDIEERKKVAIELVKAKEKAEESDRLKSAFLANMSHEIRTPMNGILGFTTLLRNPDLAAEKRNEFISVIQRSGERLLSTINDLINISKIEAGIIELTTRKADLNKITGNLYDFFLPEAEGKGLQLLFSAKLPEKYSIVETDVEKISSILTNLMKNAIKYTFKGNIEFALNYLSDDSGPKIEFYIKDTGIGIPAKNLNSIFERFMQAERPKNILVEGSGLGLSITRSYVELLGGTITVESEENRGSLFRVVIPYTP